MSQPRYLSVALWLFIGQIVAWLIGVQTGEQAAERALYSVSGVFAVWLHRVLFDHLVIGWRKEPSA